MTDERASTPATRRTRRGLVLGAGGVLGFAWEVGALTALVGTTGRSPTDADVLVGTSAGSVMAALVACGVEPDGLLAHQRGASEGAAEVEYDYERDSDGPLPPFPRLRPSSLPLLARVLAHPRRYPPMAAVSSVLPEGRGSLHSVGRMVREALAGAGRPRDAWAPHPACWVVAMDAGTGRRTAFGSPGAPPAALADAVTASCTIPGWYAPARIGGRSYVDGGVCSPFSADLLVGQDLDEVVVLAPMAAAGADLPGSVLGRLERRYREISTRRLETEVRRLRLDGVAVTVLAPGPEDLRAMGHNLMDPSRREEVLETSVRTSRERLARLADGDPGPGASTSRAA